jgi:hypothetical protein
VMQRFKTKAKAEAWLETEARGLMETSETTLVPPPTRECAETELAATRSQPVFCTRAARNQPRFGQLGEGVESLGMQVGHQGAQSQNRPADLARPAYAAPATPLAQTQPQD